MEAVILLLCLFLIAVGIYFIPFIIAWFRDHNINGIFLVNLLAGWTLIGWIIALAMACSEKRNQNMTVIKEIVTVHPTALPPIDSPSA